MGLVGELARVPIINESCGITGEESSGISGGIVQGSLLWDFWRDPLHVM